MVFAPVWQLKVAVKYWPGAVLKAGHDCLHSSRQHNSSINAVVKCGFPRKLRLLTSTAFDAVFQQPCRAASGQLTLLGRVNGLNHPRIGIIIAKKQVKCASRRNRLKRLLRESFRQHQSRLPAMDFLAIAKKGIETLDNRTLIQMLETLWKRHCRSI